MPINNYSCISKQYASLDNSGTAFLAFKIIPKLINKYSIGRKTLDYGCGSGHSTAFLKELGLDATGVDISVDMLKEAKLLNPSISFELIKSGQLPYENNCFDIVFSSFVLFEIPTKAELTTVIKEIYRTLRKGGIFIGVTGSSELYSHDWLSLNVDYEQNRNLKSGDVAKVLLKEANLIVYDYYWTDMDYREIFSKTKFNLLETHLPLGEKRDGYQWRDESLYPPYIVYVLQKTR